MVALPELKRCAVELVRPSLSDVIDYAAEIASVFGVEVGNHLQLLAIVS